MRSLSPDGSSHDLFRVNASVESINISKNIQKEPWFIKLNPNGRIPVIVDHARNDFAVFETAAILLYLQQHYDKDNKLGWDPKESPDEYSKALQWIFFAVSQPLVFHQHALDSQSVASTVVLVLW